MAARIQCLAAIGMTRQCPEPNQFAAWRADEFVFSTICARQGKAECMDYCHVLNVRCVTTIRKSE